MTTAESVSAREVDLHHPAEASPLRPMLPLDAPRVTVVIPTKNEAANLPWVFERMPLGVSEVVLVDAHSTDDTVEVARAVRPDVVVVQQTRRGKGNALACAFEVVTGDIIVMLDADGSAHPAEIVPFVEALMAGADFAKGSRFRKGGGSSDITMIRRCGNAVLSRLVNRLFRAEFTDLCYGYNAFWAHCVPYLELPPTAGTEARTGDGFEIETLINVRVATSPLVIEEVPSFESQRLHGSSNLNAVRDGLRVLRTIVEERRRLRSSSRAGAPVVDVFVPYPTESVERRTSLVLREDVA